MNYCSMVNEFTKVCNENLPVTPTPLTWDDVDFISNMVNDELKELGMTLRKPVESETEVLIANQADALVDAIYYLCDTARRKGINLDPLFNIVHTANMQKIIDGKIIRRKDGKILKPENWQDPFPLALSEIKKQMGKI